ALTVIPGGLSMRVRGIEVHGAAVDKAVAGHRAALNLGGVAVEDLARGDLLAHPGRVAASHILDVELRYLRSAPGPLAARSKVLVHHGTAQVLASLELVDKKELAPGETGLAQLRLDQTTPLGALPDDHFIVRGFVETASGGSTIGGGRIVRVLAPKARRGEVHAQTVAALAAAKLDQRVALDIKAAAFAGLAVDDLVRRIGAPVADLEAPLAKLVASGEVLAIGDHYLHAQAIAELEQKISKLVGTSEEGLPREELRTQLPAALPARAYDAVLAGLEKRGLVSAAADRVRKSAAPKTAALSPVEAAVLAKLEQTGIEPPRPKELPGALGLAEPQVKTALDKLVAAKLAIKVKPDLVMHARTVADIRTRLLAFLDQHGTIDAQQWKDLTGASRKFTIPLAEYFDAEKLTLRVGDVRRRR
ncbi:MAG TPA: SelB C-terminal domain-containing protein, partial [Kofleriaceae bacterium]|nr:SelB C-terminal domain-containing protein [Kofleriaceae bacterium]